MSRDSRRNLIFIPPPLVSNRFYLHSENTASGAYKDSDVYSANDQDRLSVALIANDESTVDWGKGNTKTEPNDKQATFKFLLDIPAGAKIRRVTFSWTPADPGGTFTVGYMGLLRTGVLDGIELGICSEEPVPSPMQFPTHRPGQWNARGTHYEQCLKGAQPVAGIYDVASGWPAGRVGSSSTTGPSTRANGGQPDYKVSQDGIKSMGVTNLVAPAGGFDLGRIHCRASRNDPAGGSTSRPSTNLVLECFYVISAENPRIKLWRDGPIATSDDYAWDDLKSGSVSSSLDPDTATNWAEFVFSGDDQITLAEGERWAFRMVEKGSDTVPGADGPPYLRWARDNGRTGDGDPDDGMNNDAAGLWWTSGGFSQGIYHAQFDVPDAMEAETTNIMPDTVFEDVRLSFASYLPGWETGQRLVYGDDIEHKAFFPIDKGLDIRIVGLVDLFQRWVDATDTGNGEPYNPSGQPTAIWFCSAATGVVDPVKVASNDQSVYPSPTLEIEYR
jgi:hypothetical protein